MILLGTGTRHAKPGHAHLIREELARFGDNVEFWHGAAPGFDTIAATIAAQLGWTVRAWRAEWAACTLDLPYDDGGCPSKPHRKVRHNGATYCPRAGNRRNAQMVTAGPDQALAMPAIGSAGRSGTWDAIHRCGDHGIRVTIRPLLLALTTNGTSA